MTQTVLIIGAAGGLGAAIAQEFARQGAQLLLVGRNRERVTAVAHEFGQQAVVYEADITDLDSLNRLAETVIAAHPHLDVIINATGFDVRKGFLQHTLAEIEQLVAVNLQGTILLTRAFLPQLVAQQHGTMVHLGGFADGRLAFPFYSVDVATRAGVRSFLEAVNRELEGSGVTLMYFCPAAADTPAERPYQTLWQEMGIQLVAPRLVAAAVYQAVQQRRTVHIMGGGARLLAAINAVWPRLADGLLLRRYRAILQRQLAPESGRN